MNVMKLMVVALAGGISRQQEDVIDYATAGSGFGGMLRYYYRDAA